MSRFLPSGHRTQFCSPHFCSLRGENGGHSCWLLSRRTCSPNFPTECRYLRLLGGSLETSGKPSLVLTSSRFLWIPGNCSRKSAAFWYSWLSVLLAHP